MGKGGARRRRICIYRRFQYQSFSGKLEILEPYGKVHVYDLSGNYIEIKQITFPGFRIAHTLAAIDEQTHVFHTMFEPEKKLFILTLTSKSCYIKNLKKIGV